MNTRNDFLETLKFDSASAIEEYSKYMYDYKPAFYAQAMRAHWAISKLFPEVDFITVCRIKSFQSAMDKAKNKGIENVYDIHGIRHVINSITEIDEKKLTEQDLIRYCYKIKDYMKHYYEHLGIELIPDREKDYIKNPKENGYQALHLSGIVQNGTNRRFETQIKTTKMDEYAKFGNANHAEKYKPRELGQNPLTNVPRYAIIRTEKKKPVLRELTMESCFQYFYNVPYSRYIERLGKDHIQEK